MPFVAFVNAAKNLSNTDADVIVESLRAQLPDFISMWPGLGVMPPIFVGSENNLPQDAYPIAFIDNPDIAGDAAYHSVDAGGKYFGHVFVDMALANGASPFTALAVAAGHEYFELLGDPTCSLVIVGPAIAEGSRYLFELCDPVQASKYSKTVNRNGSDYVVQCTDIAGPGYFGQPGAMSFMTSQGMSSGPPAPFKPATGGYQIVFDEHSTESNLWGTLPPAFAVRRDKAIYGRRARHAGNALKDADISPIVSGALVRRW